MFGLFKRKSKIDKLYDKYDRLIRESHKLSSSSRIESERKYVYAQEVLKQIEMIKE